MKSFLLSLFVFFCVTMMSAQEIPEDQFIQQLEKKQQELYTLIDQKDSISIEIKLISKKIEKLTDEAEKKKEEEKKEKLERNVSVLKNKISKKCNDFSEYQSLLKKFQSVSTELLNKYKVRVCQLYEIEDDEGQVADESDQTKTIKALEKRQKAINSLVDVKDGYDWEIEGLNKKIRKVKSEIEDAAENSTELDDLKKSLKDETKKRDSILKLDNELKKEIMDSCNKFKEYKKFLKEHENVKDSILSLFKARDCRLFEEKEQHDPEKFFIIGDNEPIKASDLLSNDNTKKVLADIFSIDSKTNLGTFEIPGDNSFVNFYAKNRKPIFLFIFNKNQKNKVEEFLENKNSYENENSYAISVKQLKLKTSNANTKPYEKPYFEEQVPEGALFKSIQIELREGGIVDTRLVLRSTDNKFEFYFEGTAPVSILHYSRKASKRNFLKYSHYISLDGQGVYNESALENLLVKYTDVLDYHPNAGSNYVPDDVSYKFPSNKDKEAKETERRSYQVINNNHLQNVLDLRTYTDLLGLFGDESNGLFQVEGQADFFIHPFNFPRTGLYYLKKISPYVRYSRFDDDTGFVKAEGVIVNNDDGTMSTEYLIRDKKLALLEKSNLEMGVDLNLINFRWFKESPLWTSIYFPLSYNATKVRTDADDDSNDANYKTLGFGFGIDLEIRRFNNFGLNIGYELKGHSFIGDYSEFNIEEPGYLKTQAVKAEVFYYPGLDKSNSIFLRMKSIRDISSGNADSFFQLQVGYRFTLGVGAVKAQ